MTSRERVIRTVEFSDPDRLPIFIGMLPAGLLKHGEPLRELLSEFPNDFGFNPRTASVHLGPSHTPGVHRDEWGTVWKVEQAGMIGIVQESPLEDWDSFRNFAFPSLPPEEHWEAQKKTLADPGREYYAFGWGTTFFERLQQLRGYENLMMDIACDEPLLHELMDRIVEWYLPGLEKSLQTGVDGVHFADDWGTQQALMISPESWRKWFKPRYARMFAPIKGQGKHVWFHTDGYTLPIFEDLREIGCDVINPQHTIIGEEELGRRFAGRIAFRTDFDRQHVLPHGTSDDIREHVKNTIKHLATPHGGAILHGEISSDVPLDNIRWMLEACIEFGVRKS